MEAPASAKTHLMHAIGNAILETNPSANVMYVTSEQFSNALISVLMRKDPIDDFRKQYRGVDVLLLDDVQFLAGKGRCLRNFSIPLTTFTMQASKSYFLRISRHMKSWNLKSAYVPALPGG